MGIRWHPSKGERLASEPMCSYRLNRDGLVAVLEQKSGPSYVTAVLRLQSADIACLVEEEVGTHKSWLLLGRHRVLIGKHVAIKVSDHIMRQPR